MKKILRLTLMLLLLVAVSSCQKSKYCRCSAVIDNEVVELGEDLFIIEHGNCSDKAKEIIGWGTVTCVEEQVEGEQSFWDRIFEFFNHSNNNNNNHNNNKP